ncbi:hypothetical protein HPB49_023425 [Dermacentor silvarum]|uniref:Uncharacterized protein n=1 Tax=Dermacentor silvarum TaxID=543639 RepID=A0ACB8DGL7_DERSI|nr:hypothetical protein HPB49_023425 [Dermacentor silvarum]
MDKEVYLQTFRAFVVKNNRSRYIRGILGGGSQRLFITQDLAVKLQLQILGETRMAFNTFGNASPSSDEVRKVVEVPLRSQHCSDIRIAQAIIVPVICHDIAAPTADNNFIQKLRREGKFLADDKNFLEAETENGLKLLIGADHLWKIMTGEVVRSKEVQGLAAINAALGWTLQGPSRQKAFLDCDANVMVCVLRLETISDNETLSWNEDQKQLLGSNHDTSLTRIQKLAKRLSMKKGLLERYDTVTRQYLELGHAEVVLKDVPIDGATYYTPHREVTREESLTTKLRVVLDASSHAQGFPSLKDCCDKGFNLNPELLQVRRSSCDSTHLHCVMCTGSTSTLSCIRGDYEKLDPFVKHGVNKIAAISDPLIWRYFPGEDNPSDLLTRGVSLKALRTCRSWWRGPEWLSQPRPTCPTDSDMSTPIYEESECDTQHALIQAPEKVDTLMDARKFSKLQKLLPVTTWVSWFADRSRPTQTSLGGTISTEELNLAEMFRVCRVQLEVFTNYIEHLRLRDTVKKHLYCAISTLTWITAGSFDFVADLKIWMLQSPLQYVLHIFLSDIHFLPPQSQPTATTEL